MRERIGFRIGRRLRRRFFAVPAALALVGALGAIPASGFSQRGYVYSPSLSFGSEGSGAGQMLDPQDVAVNQVTGDIYVADTGNNRVDQFHSNGEFVRAWGWSVAGGKGFQECNKTVACTKGTAGIGRYEMHPTSIAVDSNPKSPSFGDVYVLAVKEGEPVVKKGEEAENSVIDKFKANGVPIRAMPGYQEGTEERESLEEWEEVNAIATDDEGDLWVFRGSEELIELDNKEAGEVDGKKVRKFEANLFLGEFEAEFGKGQEPRELLAVGDRTHLYVGHAEIRAAGRAPAPTEVAEEAILEITEEGESRLETVPRRETLVSENTTGVAVSPTNGDVLVAAGENVTLESGEQIVQRFGAVAGETGILKEGTGVAFDEAADSFVVADAGTGRIVAFAREPAGAPKVEVVRPSETHATTAVLTATIAPGGSATTYRYRYTPEGSVPSASEPCSSPCAEAPVPAAALGEGAEGDFANVDAAPVELQGLTPLHVYHYKLIAENATGTGESSEQELKTQPEVLGETLPDHRSWQDVSVQGKAKNGGVIEPMTGEGGVDQASASGSSVTYVATNAPYGAKGNRAPEPSQLYSHRTEDSTGSHWSDADISPPSGSPQGIVPGSPRDYRAFSPDLSLGLLFTYGHSIEPPLAEGITEFSGYLAHVESCVDGEANCYTPLVDSEDTSFEGERIPWGKNLEWEASNTSGEVSILQSPPLTKERALTGQEELYEWNAAKPVGERLKLVSVLTDGTGLLHAHVGRLDQNTRYAVSSDGSRVDFEALIGEKEQPHLYQRDVATGTTLRVDTPEAGLPEEAQYTPHFQSGNEEGTLVYFTDEAKLTRDSTASYLAPDLYVCEVAGSEAEPRCNLKDLTVDSHAGEPANVLGTVSAVTPDGSRVFFVADGSLSSDAPAGSCRLQEEEENVQEHNSLLSSTCNLYTVAREGDGWSSPKLVTTLSVEDEPDWGGVRPGLGFVTARVSPNGEWFTFMSDRRLPTATNPSGYDNVDAASGRPDEEVFLYHVGEASVGEGTLLCASCDPSGAAPRGVYDVELAEEAPEAFRRHSEGGGILVDRNLNWVNHWLGANIPPWTDYGLGVAAYQSRYLLNDGRLFFDTSQSLVPQDTNGNEDVYEYEPTTVLAPDGSTPECTTSSPTYAESALGCISLISSGKDARESAFVDASESGDDVFFVTAASLAPGDIDGEYDLYDAAICGVSGAPACVPAPAATPPQCGDATSCQNGGGSLGGLPPSAAGSSVASGSGNTSRVEVLGSKETKKPAVKKPTRAQLYAKALKACKKIKNKRKRAKCDAAAKKKYGPKKKAKKKANKSARGR